MLWFSPLRTYSVFKISFSPFIRSLSTKPHGLDTHKHTSSSPDTADLPNLCNGGHFRDTRCLLMQSSPWG